MKVLVGPTAYAVEMEVSSSSAGGGGGGASFVNDKEETSCLFLTGSENSSEISSSIGDPEDSDVEDDGHSGGDKDVEIASSKLCLDSLEDSLPIKRGLSSHFTGKSKSFTNLADVSSGSNTCSVKDLEKPENPFNKRRRVLIANKLARKTSFYSWQNPKSMPLLTVHEDHDDDDDEADHQTVAEENDEDEDEDEEKKNRTRVCGNRLKKKIAFKSHSCFSLADLHEEDEADEYR